MFSASKPVHTCDVDFTITLSDEQAIGADLALYKTSEQGDGGEGRRYMVYIARENQAGFPHTLITNRTILSTSHGWQIFNIDTEAVDWSIGESNLSIKIIVTSANGTVLPCKPIFFLGSEQDQTQDMQQPSDSPRDDTPQGDLASYVPIVTTFSVTTELPLCVKYPESCNGTRQESTAIPDGERERRYTEEHNYVQQIFAARENFKRENCSVLFNGQEVSPLHCNSDARLKFAFANDNAEQSDDDGITCDVQFEIQITEGDSLLGADLVLYKNTTESSSITYWVFLIEQITPTFNDLIVDKEISGDVNGWLTFHINNKTTDKWTLGNNSFLVRLFVYRIEGYDYTRLKCSDVSSIFILPSGAEGSAIPTGSDALIYPEINYIPVVTAFVEGSSFQRPNSPFRTSRSTDADSLQRPSKKDSPLEVHKEAPRGRKECRLVDRTIKPPELFQGNNIKVLPRTVNVGECVTGGEKQPGDDTTDVEREGRREEARGARFEDREDPQCLPLKTSSLDVLVQTPVGARIESIPNAIVEECGYTTAY